MVGHVFDPAVEKKRQADLYEIERNPVDAASSGQSRQQSHKQTNDHIYTVAEEKTGTYVPRGEEWRAFQ